MIGFVFASGDASAADAAALVTDVYPNGHGNVPQKVGMQARHVGKSVEFVRQGGY